MKLSDKSANMTSFHGTVIKTTVNKLIEKVGEPQYNVNNGDDKINFDWICETSLGGVFTIYDWKEYRILDLNEEIEFHIGGRSQHVTERAKEELETLLND